jgi:hypothetical protein
MEIWREASKLTPAKYQLATGKEKSKFCFLNLIYKSGFLKNDFKNLTNTLLKKRL